MSVWDTINKEKEKTKLIKANILAKHSLTEKSSKNIKTSSITALNKEQLRTLELKKSLHSKYGLSTPELPIPIKTSQDEKKNKVFIEPFREGREPRGPERPKAQAIFKTETTKEPKLKALSTKISQNVAQVTDLDLDVPPEFLQQPTIEEEEELAEEEPIVEATSLGLASYLTNSYGPHWAQWEPETIRATLTDDLNIAPEFIDGILAIALCLSTDKPWEEWPVLEKVVVALNERIPQFAIREHISPAELSHAIAIMRGLRKVEWTTEVLSWIAAICHQHGLIWLPPPLDIAQAALDYLNKDRLLTREIFETWNAIKDDEDLDDFPFKETPLGVQLARLTAIQIYRDNMGTS